MTLPPYLLALIPALIAIESNGNNRAVGDNGKAWGCLQITQGVLTDIYAHGGPAMGPVDCFDREKSIQAFAWYMSIWCTEERLGHYPTQADAARIWNGGPHALSKPETLAYWDKVKARL